VAGDADAAPATTLVETCVAASCAANKVLFPFLGKGGAALDAPGSAGVTPAVVSTTADAGEGASDVRADSLVFLVRFLALREVGNDALAGGGCNSVVAEESPGSESRAGAAIATGEGDVRETAAGTESSAADAAAAGTTTEGAGTSGTGIGTRGRAPGPAGTCTEGAGTAPEDGVAAGDGAAAEGAASGTEVGTAGVHSVVTVDAGAGSEVGTTAEDGARAGGAAADSVVGTTAGDAVGAEEAAEVAICGVGAGSDIGFAATGGSGNEETRTGTKDGTPAEAGAGLEDETPAAAGAGTEDEDAGSTTGAAAFASGASAGVATIAFSFCLRFLACSER
jgi:hypothetical protein